MITEIRLHLDSDFCACSKALGANEKQSGAVQTGVVLVREQEPPVAFYKVECLKCGATIFARVDKTPGNVTIDRR